MENKSSQKSLLTPTCLCNTATKELKGLCGTASRVTLSSHNKLLGAVLLGKNLHAQGKGGLLVNLTTNTHRKIKHCFHKGFRCP